MCVIKRALCLIGLLSWSFMSSVQAMQDENYEILTNFESTDPIDFLTHIIDNDRYDHELDCVIVERIPFEQLDLSLLSEQQTLQKSQACGKGTLFFYESELIAQVFKKFSGIKNYGLRSLFRYEPSQKNKNLNPTALFVIHGTYGEKSEGYFDYATDQFQGFVHYATEKAEKEGRSVDIFSLRWSGENSDRARIQAGIFLGFFLNMIKTSYDNLDVIAFSHGCNLALVAANILIDGYKIREFIALAPPILEDNGWFYAPHNIKYFFPFISRGDFVTTLGRFYSTSFKSSCAQWQQLCEKSSLKEPFDKQGKVYDHPCERNGIVINVHYTHNNEHPSHSQMPPLIAHILEQLMEKLYVKFTYDTCVRNISLNWVSQELSEKHGVVPLNISLYPQSIEEELVYAKKLRIETLYDSAQHEQDHEKVYKIPKNHPDSYIYSFYNKMRNLLK